MARRIAELGFDVTGVDFMLSDKLPVHPSIKYLEGSICDIPFPDRAFDYVISTDTLEHIVDIQRAISELRRVCRHKLIIVVPCQREYRWTFALHINFFPYIDSFMRVMGNNSGKCFKLGGDIMYVEDVA
ncbi:hypothetical protein RsTz2092_07480 [Deferribacterales bacterium RsTz2092]|nr:hypothetical protein AGMMS49941_09550 [Deferribacterales bacterium]